MATELNKQCADAIRVLSIDAIQKAKSGHPGAPMGMADIAEVLWRHNLNHNPLNPHWANRDRFVLSNGHASMLLWSILHLTGYNLSIDDLKQFRQLHSKTPGHPEVGETDGVETTTGPLGQGISNAVGMALAEALLANEFNRPNHNIIDHYTYCFLGDGCLMEGVASESCSLAGTFGLNKLIVFYDSNNISIDGEVTGWFNENVADRFRAYDWFVIDHVDGHDPKAIQQAIDQAKAQSERPTLIICKTIIGRGAPNKQGDCHIHGSPLGDDEILATKKSINWPSEEPFFVPENVYQAWNAAEKGTALEKAWNEAFASYQAQYPELAQKLSDRLANKLEDNLETIMDSYIKVCQEGKQKLATRKASQLTLDAYCPHISSVLGGSCDLSPSNLTMWKGCVSLKPHHLHGNYIHYGVREFGMNGMMNGISLHGGFVPFGGTFLTFSTYGLNGIRMAALMKAQVTYVLTHDSIGVGEDGPTHQPNEVTSTLRLIPNLSVWRPCDHAETAVAWKHALLLNRHQPTAICLTRQDLEHQHRTDEQLADISKGAYILVEAPSKNPQAIFVATGSEVELAVKVANRLNAEGKEIRVVSMPCIDLFEKQSAEYREHLFPLSVRKRIALEMGSTAIWYKYVGLDGLTYGIDGFGLCGKAGDLFKEFGFTEDQFYDVAVNYLNK